jgi:hypothetical protein
MYRAEWGYLLLSLWCLPYIAGLLLSVHRHESAAKRPGALASTPILRERWAAGRDERAVGGQEACREAIHYGDSRVVLRKLGMPLAFSAAARWRRASAIRHATM